MNSSEDVEIDRSKVFARVCFLGFMLKLDRMGEKRMKNWWREWDTYTRKSQRKLIIYLPGNTFLAEEEKMRLIPTVWPLFIHTSVDWNWFTSRLFLSKNFKFRSIDLNQHWCSFVSWLFHFSLKTIILLRSNFFGDIRLFSTKTVLCFSLCFCAAQFSSRVFIFFFELSLENRFTNCWRENGRDGENVWVQLRWEKNRKENTQLRSNRIRNEWQIILNERVQLVHCFVRWIQFNSIDVLIEKCRLFLMLTSALFRSLMIFSIEFNWMNWNEWKKWSERQRDKPKYEIEKFTFEIYSCSTVVVTKPN